LDYFDLNNKKKAVNIYLSNNEDTESYRDLIDELNKNYQVSIFLDGNRDTKDTLKSLLKTY
jgi:hypothetical protein